jgi:hypothetical protein
MSRSKLINAAAKTQNGALGALQRRNRAKPAPEILPFSEHPVLSDILKGPIHQEFRDGDYIHVSDLIYKCARKIALSKRMDQPIDPEPLFDSTSLTFKQGEAMAEFIVGKVASKAPRNAYGIWGCRCGVYKVEGTKHDVKDSQCDVCGHDLTLYHEIVIKDEELRLSGSIDLLLQEDKAFVITELKSMKKDQWEELQRPVPEHLIQVLFYWYLMQKAGRPLHDKVSILYAVKDYVFKSPYKEFVIQPSSQLYRLDDYLEEARVLTDAIHKRGPLPARVSCPSQDSPAAKKCQFREVCFQL